MSARTMASGRGPRSAGLVLSATGAAIAWATADTATADTAAADTRLEHAPLPPLTGDAWPALAQALRAWATRAGEPSLALHVALLAPLAELRTVTIPPVGPDDARRLLARTAARHFLTASEPLAIGVAPPAANADRAGITDGGRLAAAAPRRVLRALEEAVRSAGCTLRVIVPASAVPVGPSEDGAHGMLLVQDRTLEITGWHGDRPVSLRRFREDDDAEEIIAACRAVRGPVTLVADATTRTRLAPALIAAGVRVVEPAGRPRRDDEPDAVAGALARRLATWPAAAASPDTIPLALRTEPEGASVRAPDAGRGRRVVAALLLALAAGGVHRVGLLRELDAVRAERAALEPTLTTLGLREGDPQAAWRALADSARNVTRWSAVLGALGTTLPADAHLLALRALGDTLTLEGVARNASATFAALERSAALRAVAATGPVRRERTADGGGAERFTFRARVEGARP